MVRAVITLDVTPPHGKVPRMREATKRREVLGDPFHELRSADVDTIRDALVFAWEHGPKEGRAAIAEILDRIGWVVA